MIAEVTRAVAVALAVAFVPAAAAGHAIVIESEPKANAEVGSDDLLAVRLRFNSRVDAKRSRVILESRERDGPKAPVVLALVADPAGDLITSSAAAGSLVPGRWRLRWQVLAIDGHITRGDIPFRVTPR